MACVHIIFKIIYNIIRFLVILYYKASFMPYMLGVNTRFYGATIFKTWFVKLSLLKFIVYSIKTSTTPLTKVLYLEPYMIFFNFYKLVYEFIINKFAINSLRRERFVLWSHFCQILIGWGLWFNNFFDYCFKCVLCNHRQKVKIYMFFFKIYAKLRIIYFRFIILMSVVHSSKRRRWEV